jgi:hypothetical protein
MSVSVIDRNERKQHLPSDLEIPLDRSLSGAAGKDVEKRERVAEVVLYCTVNDLT